jgi:hypothetical protein
MGAGSKDIGVGVSKHFETDIMPPCVVDAGHRAIGFNGCPTGFGSWFGLISSFNFSILNVWNGKM